MLKKIYDVFAGIPMTAVGGLSLALSFFLPRAGVSLPADPAWAAVIICGIPLLYLSVWRIIYNPGISKISSALLITIAMFAAAAIGDIFAAGEVAFIMSVGAILEEKTTDRAKQGLAKLIELAPVKARRLSGGIEEMIRASEVRCGDILRILPGETIPADGKVISGETSVDQSVMTGESLPVDKCAGDSVFCGTINRFGAIDIETVCAGEDTSLQKLIRMVRDAENKQAPMQRIADKCASWLVPAALMIAVAAYLYTGNIVTAVTILVVFCPCGLVLATPTAVMAAIGQAARRGVIIKSGEALERMGKVDTIAFDKTGTLTYGRLEVSEIIPFDRSVGETGLISLAASAELKSEHPLGKTITSYARSKNIILSEPQDFRMYGGRGVGANVSGRAVLCGSDRFLGEKGISATADVSETLARMRNEGKAAVSVAAEGKCIGVIALSDEMRPGAGEIISSLSSMGTSSVLLTGDNARTAAHFAAQAGITDVRADLLPAEKVSCIEDLQNSGRAVCMIGDGINDAPALKAAYVGAAMGAMGSDIAVDAADIALMGDDLSAIPYLKRLSDAAVSTIKLSITLSMCINAAAIVCSLLGLLNPTAGALVHNAGSCTVVLIAALLYDRKFD